MSETTRHLEEDDSPEPVAGERLAAARRARDISLRDIAKELHLDEPKVQALEDNRFDDLGAPVFAKGHLRKYAELVGVSVEDVLTDYYQLNRAAAVPPVVGPVRRQPREIAIGPWLIAIAAVALVAGASAWWFARDPSTGVESPPATAVTAEPRRDEQPAPIPVETEATPDIPPATELEDTPSMDLVETTPSQGLPDDAAPPAGIAGEVSLRLEFSGECWTEVTDAGGSMLFFDLGRDGRVVNVSGEAPLRVLLGDSFQVRLFVEGTEYAIDPSDRRGNTARLTIEQP